MNNEAKITFSIAGLVVVGAILLMIITPNTSEAPKIVDTAYLVATSSHMTAKKGAKVTVVEFGDYQCPACGATEPIFEQVIAAYAANPNFNFVFRNFPLPMHGNALIAAEAAEAAGAQGKFWEMHHLLYTNQNDWAESTNPIDFFTTYATTLGLNVTKFKTEVENKKYQSVIDADQSDGNAANVSWTPTIYINGELQQSTPSFSEFKTKIDILLQK